MPSGPRGVPDGVPIDMVLSAAGRPRGHGLSPDMTRHRIDPRDQDSKTLAGDARLRYVSDRRPGLRRKRCGAGFRYVTADGKQVNREESKRIRALAIPPAWEQVWICPYPNGHMQVTGRDAKGRKQYIYHPQWHAIRKETKFH